MRILLTGGAGFLGRHVAHALSTRGDTVTVLDDLSCPNSTFESTELRSPRIECILGSTLDKRLVRRLVPEHPIIIHMASVVGVEETIQRPFDTMRNLEGTLNVVESLERSQVVLFTSSADVYGVHSRLYERPMREDDLQLFEGSAVNRWVYPKIKALEENAVLHGPGRGIVVRVFNCFGPGMDFPHGKRVVPQFIERILARMPLRISGSGEQRRALCYYTDTVRGILLAMHHLADDPGAQPVVLNIGSAETWTMLQLAETLQEIALEIGLLDEPLPVERHARLYSQAFDDTWHRTPDLQRAEALLGYKPTVPAREGLRRTLEHYAAERVATPKRHAARVLASRKAGAAGTLAPSGPFAGVTHDTDVLILGGGVAGLSCRAALEGSRETLLLEAENEVGGLLRVHRHGDFIFDTTVHAIVCRNPSVRRLLDDLLPAGLRRFEKQNLIWQAGTVVDYPYQFHLRQLPPWIRRACIETVPEDAGSPPPPDRTFESWLLARFGSGLYRHFFEPYNRKLYGVHPSELEAAPMVWTIPVGNRAAILAGARETRARRQPAVECLYPRGADGVSALVRALADRSAAPILCGHRVMSIDLGRRQVETSDGVRVRYRALVSSLPLPALAGMIRDAGALERAATLAAAPITVVQVGAGERQAALDADWTYFPDADVPFYRLTRLERIAPDLCPQGKSAFLLECPGQSAPEQLQVLELLAALGVISSPQVEWYGTVHIPEAYVLFRPGAARTVSHLLETLQALGVRSIGRYGEWRYANIEQCIVSGLEAARQLATTTRAESLQSPFDAVVEA